MSDPLSSLVSSINFSVVEVDVVTVATAIMLLVLVVVGVRTILNVVSQQVELGWIRAEEDEWYEEHERARWARNDEYERNE